MFSEAALIGMRVRVSDYLRRSDLRGLEGTIAGRWGPPPHYLALDVLFEDGRLELFWHHDLVEVK